MPSSSKIQFTEITFKPKYPGRIMLTVYLYPLGVIICVLSIYMALVTHRIFPYGIVALIFGFTITSMPLILFREIKFIEDRFIVKRYFLPRKTILYQDTIGLTPRGVIAKRGGIPLANVQNRKEFDRIIHRLISSNKLKLEK